MLEISIEFCVWRLCVCGVSVWVGGYLHTNVYTLQSECIVRSIKLQELLEHLLLQLYS